MVTEAAVVDMVPVDGVVMVSAGAVVSAPPPPEPVVVTDCLVKVTDFEMRLAAVDAVMVTVFAPITSGRLTMLHSDASPAAVPDAPPLDDHITVMTPVEPAADPDRLALEAVVVEATAFIVRVRGGVGAGVVGGAVGGTIVAEVCAAYSVRIAATSGAAKVVTIL